MENFDSKKIIPPIFAYQINVNKTDCDISINIISYNLLWNNGTGEERAA